MKRKLTRFQFERLKKELAYLEEKGHLTKEHVESMLGEYEVDRTFPFLRYLLIIGALLIGAGVFSFVAGNWDFLPRMARILLLFLGLIGFYLAGYKTEESYPRTSRSLYYIGFLIYGAAIFLLSDMFSIQIRWFHPFLFWAIGAIPLFLYLRDRWLVMASIVLMEIYVVQNWDDLAPYPFAVLLFLPFLYWINEKRFASSQAIFALQNLLFLSTLLVTLEHLVSTDDWNPFVIFLFGLVLYCLPLPQYAKLREWQGTIIHGIGALYLTNADSWSFLFGSNENMAPLSFASYQSMKSAQMISLLFLLIYVVWLLWLLRKGVLASVLVFAALIFRYYVDFSYDALPKSLFFLIGGAVLIVFGYWFEKKRRKKDGKDE